MASGTIAPTGSILIVRGSSFAVLRSRTRTLNVEPRTSNPNVERRMSMRYTKIIATVGPASDSDGMLDALIAAGTDIFRLNFSHGTHDSQAATFARVRGAADRARRAVAVLQDLGGPKIRTGEL